MSDHDHHSESMTSGDLRLIPDDCGDAAADLIYDENGAITTERLADPRRYRPEALVPERRIPLTRPCSLGLLNGSWNITIQPKGMYLAGSLRGPMRLEAVDGVLRVSGDMYYKPWMLRYPDAGRRVLVPRGDLGLAEDAHMSPVATATAVAYWNLNWYPHYPFDEYSWYFRSTGATYSGGELYFPLVRHLWDRSAQDFASTDTGWMRFTCTRSILASRWYPQPTVKMTGEAMIGGQLHTVTATKTSPYYRGCVVEVDVMTDRSWPASAASTTFAGTYRADGFDVSVRISQTNIPEDNSLTDGEMHTLLSTWRDISDIGNTWRVWVLVGSKRSGSNTFGLMFDQAAPHREGCVSYSDATFSASSSLVASAKNKKLGEVPAGHLRTLVHEVGHVLNLYHPKSDVHNPGTGTTIMNQTGDVMGFATPPNLYPNNATFAFSGHNRTSLIHSPDPQVAPGWKPFGWGHGSLFSGVPEPTDVIGLNQPEDADGGLTFELAIAPTITRGEFVTVDVTVTNQTGEPVPVSGALNLSEGDLEVEVKTPSGETLVVRDIVQTCGPARTVSLADGESMTRTIQLFYGNCGHTFDEVGRYEVRARFLPDPASGVALDSGAAVMTVAEPSTDEERALADLSMDPDVGLAVALGDFTDHEDCAARLKDLSTAHTDSDMGTAAALVLANSFGRTFRNVREGTIVRKRNAREVASAIDLALADTGTVRVAQIATTVASPGDSEAPVVVELMDQLSGGGAAALDAADSQEALRILEDFSS